MRKFTERKIVIASHNAGKVREIGALLAPFGVEVISAGELNLGEPVEDADSFIGNAAIKAHAAAKASGLPALADDSGLEVAALDGAPGIYSARWAGPKKDFNIAIYEVLSKIADQDNRKANFTCALTLAWPDGHAESFEGKVFGTLSISPRGEKGFGYDPIFIAEGMNQTFAEIEPAAKHAISHRAHAFQQLVDACFAD